MTAVGEVAQTVFDSEIPVRPANDNVMASQSEARDMHQWVCSAFDIGKTGPVGLLPDQPPFSFTYGGRPSDELLPIWSKTSKSDGLQTTVEWRDPETGLSVIAVVTNFADYPAADWVVYFENKGNKGTPIIESIQALDVNLSTNEPNVPVVLHRLYGDNCDSTCFQPFDTEIWPKQTISMTPVGGRPSNTSAFPFFNFEYDGQGIIAAIGWTDPTSRRHGADSPHAEPWGEDTLTQDRPSPVEW
jgi:hypothetical protein